MSNPADFVIENGVLKKYVGPGGDVVIPEGVKEIGMNAFQDCTNLASVTIPESVTEIGEWAFKGCTNLASVTIPESVKEIWLSAFSYCTSLASVSIPSSVTVINHFLFWGCESLTSVTIPDGVTKIDASAFSYCTSLTSITIPKGVTEIGELAFEGCRSLASVTIPDGVEKIGESAFSGCTSLASVTIPDSVTEIGGSAFRDCTSLASVTIPNSVTEIGESAFSGCTSLASLTIPDSVTEIVLRAFEGCDALERIQFTSKANFDLLWKNISEKAKFAVLVQGLHDQNADPFLLPKIKANKKKLLAFAIQKDDEEAASRLFALHKKTPLEELDEAIVQAEGAPKVRTFLLSYKAANYSLETQEKIAEIATEKELGLRERTLSDWKKIYLFESCAGGICIKNYKGDELDILIPEKIGKEKVVAIGEGAFSPEGKRITEEQKNCGRSSPQLSSPMA